MEENAIEINNDCSSCICRLLAQTKTVGRSKGNWQWHWYVGKYYTLCTLYCICLRRCYFGLENMVIIEIESHQCQPIICNEPGFLGDETKNIWILNFSNVNCWIWNVNFSNWRIVMSKMGWHGRNSIFFCLWFPAKKHLRKPMQYSVARFVYVRSCRQCSCHMLYALTLWITDSWTKID